jgi:hypothetical protein
VWRGAQTLCPPPRMMALMPHIHSHILYLRQLSVRLIRMLPAILALMFAAPAFPQDAQALLARHGALNEQLAHNPFNRPVYLESNQASDRLQGEVYAELEQPFSLVEPGLQGTGHWCDILILHLNVKRCQGTDASALKVLLGTKHDDAPEQAYEVDFNYKVVAASDTYLRIQLGAPKGPMGTQDYQIVLEAAPLSAKRSFLHLSYSYGYGAAARLAMNAYLATTGRNKIGFSVTGQDADNKPVYITGVRGVVERNTMRYYLAIETYLASVNLPPAEALEKRLNDSYAATEVYAKQLHELDRKEYLEMKHHEVELQRQ